MITQTYESCKFCSAKDSIITDFSRGQVACNACGAVLEDRIIDETYEGRNFGGENQSSSGRDQTRVGGPVSPYSDLSMGVTIAAKRNNALNKMKQRSANSAGNNRMRIFKKTEEYGQKLELKNAIIEKAKDLLTVVEKNKKLKGRSTDYIIASVIYAACRSLKVPRALADISSKLGINKKILSKCFNSIKSVIFPQNEIEVKETIIGLVNSQCNVLFLEPNVTKCAKEITKIICEKEILAGKNPTTIVGCVILIACRLLGSKVEKKEISLASNATENTILHAYSQIMQYKNDIIPEQYKQFMDKLD